MIKSISFFSSSLGPEDGLFSLEGFFGSIWDDECKLGTKSY